MSCRQRAVVEILHAAAAVMLGAFAACSSNGEDGGGPAASEVGSSARTAADPAVAVDDATLPGACSLNYMGREIAQTMHWGGAEWLVRDSRQHEEDTDTLLDALALGPGMAVCDLGCGNGFHTLRIAERVGPQGVVYAVDVQPQMLSLLRRRAERAGLDNIERIVGTATDPQLPDASCELILMVDVYHELAYPELMLQAVRRALKPGGRAAVVEFRAEDPEVPIKPRHKMSKAQIEREWTANGFRVVGSFDELPWQHLVFFARDAD